MQNGKKIYFKNFDAIRAIAALVVLISHIELHKPDYGLIRFTVLNLIPLGTISVTLFFVLSGFLITYLLISEFNISHKINIKFFYLRRILKIWPLYFMLLLITFLFYKNSVPLSSWLYSIFFLPNIPFAKNALPSIIDPIWSIGIEEQFYLFFPILFFMNNLKKVFKTLFFLFFLLVGLRFFSNILNIEVIRDYLYLGRFDCMLLGSLSAFLFYFNNEYTNLLKLIYSWQTQLFSYGLLFFYLMVCVLYNVVIIHLVFAFLFAIILINLGTNKKSIIRLESKILSKIGVVSYGIYLTHQFTNYIVLKYIHFNNNYLENIGVYVISIILSIILATVLYYNFEIHFINLKKKFSYFEKERFTTNNN